MKQFVIHAHDSSDAEALDRRMKARPTHLEGVERLKASGNYVLGGAMLDADGKMIGSTMVVRFETDADFQQYLAQEPYILDDVWREVKVYPFRIASFVAPS